MNRTASAIWHGSLKEGKGTISTQSGTLHETQYSFGTRFADGVGVLTLDLHEKPTITKIALTTKAKVPGIDKAKFDELAHNAEVGCPVSRVLKAAEITLDATLL